MFHGQVVLQEHLLEASMMFLEVVEVNLEVRAVRPVVAVPAVVVVPAVVAVPADPKQQLLLVFGQHLVPVELQQLLHPLQVEHLLEVVLEVVVVVLRLQLVLD